MMWLEFLFDRIGGPEVFQAVFDGREGRLVQPGRASKALTKVQNLVKASGFLKGFSSITADPNADQALLYTGKAAMMLHGAWTYGTMKTAGGDFVTGGHLGYMNFPPVDGGKGDPSDTVGNPGQYVSISSKASGGAEGHRQEVLRHHDARRRPRSSSGSTSATSRSSRAPRASSAVVDKDDAWLQFVYDISSKATVVRPVVGPGAAARPRPRRCWTTSASCSSCPSRRSSSPTT